MENQYEELSENEGQEELNRKDHFKHIVGYCEKLAYL